MKVEMEASQGRTKQQIEGGPSEDVISNDIIYYVVTCSIKTRQIRHI